MKVNLIIKGSFIGFHRYPAAGEREQLQDVAYLSNTHRHIFNIEMYIKTDPNNDRDYEFFQLQYRLHKVIQSYFNDHKQYYGKQVESCENIAQTIYKGFIDNGKIDGIDFIIDRIKVFEDDENGVEVIF